jgi:hypothetical protein
MHTLGLVFFLNVMLVFIWLSPRKFGRWLAKISIGFEAQRRDEGRP